MQRTDARAQAHVASATTQSGTGSRREDGGNAMDVM